MGCLSCPTQTCCPTIEYIPPDTLMPKISFHSCTIFYVGPAFLVVRFPLNYWGGFIRLVCISYTVCDRLHVLLTGGQEIVQTSDVRVSDRVPQQHLKLQSFKPLYNEISGEVKDFVLYHITLAPLISGDFQTGKRN